MKNSPATSGYLSRKPSKKCVRTRFRYLRAVTENHLATKAGMYLTGLLKIKLRDAGLRVVYKPIRTETEMIIVVIGARADDEVYDIASKRIIKHEI